jgi:predicted AlkP superfamily pyrophosphatase or phosphodiesterase
MRRLFSFAAVVAVFVSWFAVNFLLVSDAQAQAYDAKPKLVVIVVIDQFRGDYLQRYRSDLKGRGFKLLMDEGAWFPDCYYNYANTKTAPGHATIGTGAYTDGHGIESNDWWDAARSFNHKVTSVEDERYRLVDLPAGSADTPGASPHSLRASTLGDELRLATSGRSRVFGVSLKDRAAILPPGQAANAAYWIDGDSGRFTTSTYYMEHLPGWATEFNGGGRLAEAQKQAGVDGKGKFTAQMEGTTAANHYELDFAEALITGEKLGQNATTDLLTVSLSAHDIMGHRYGPDSDQERAMVMGLDSDLDRFFGWLDKQVGLGNVWIALTADHGVAPVPATAAGWGMNSATVDLKALTANVNAALAEKFPPAETRYPQSANVNFLLPGADLPYLTLDRRLFESAGISEKTAEDALAAVLPEALAEVSPAGEKSAATHRLPPTPVFAGAFTRLQMEHGELPPTELGREIAHSYANHGNWYVMLLLGGYQMQDLHSTGTTHFSPWSYDRHVPLAFYGAPFQPGTYRGRVEPVDLAATFASLLGVNMPSAAVGRVLTQSLKSDITIINR